jgi:hypothetical protein
MKAPLRLPPVSRADWSSREGDPQCVPDGGPVLDQADLHALKLPREPRVVGRQRGERVGPRGEEDDADPVGGTALDEGLDDRLDGLEPVDPLPVLLVVLAQHRAREVDREDDVVALRADFALVLDPLGPGEGADDKDEPGDVQPAVQFDAAADDERCQAAAKGTRRTGTRERPRSQTASGKGRSPEARAGPPAGSLWPQGRPGSGEEAHREGYQRLRLPPARIRAWKNRRARRNGPHRCGRQGGSGGRGRAPPRPRRGGLRAIRRGRPGRRCRPRASRGARWRGRTRRSGPRTGSSRSQGSSTRNPMVW